MEQSQAIYQHHIWMDWEKPEKNYSLQTYEEYFFKSLRTTYLTLKEQSSKASTRVGGNQLNRTTQNRNLPLETLHGRGK